VGTDFSCRLPPFEVYVLLGCSSQEGWHGRHLWQAWERLDMHCSISDGRPERRRPFGWHGHRVDDNINIDLWESGYDDVEWTQLA